MIIRLVRLKKFKYKMYLKIKLLKNSLFKIVRFIFNVLRKSWASSGTYLLLCFVIYIIYGGFLAPLLLLFIAIAGFLYKMEDNFVYHPESPPYSRVFVSTPSMYNLPYQSVYTRSADGTMLHMFFIAQPGDVAKQCPTVIFFHGNAGNMGHRLSNVSELFHNLHCNILMLEYRGYGFSHGTPSEEGLYMDAQAGLQYLFTRNDININEIIIFGRSLGAAIAIDLATKLSCNNKLKIWCLILENTFTSIPDMASVLIGMKFLKKLPLIFYKNKFMSIMKIRSVNEPTLFISGLADALVPAKMMLELYNNSPSSCKKLITIPGGTHNETWNQEGYYQHISLFIDQLRKNPPKDNKSSCHYLIDDI